MPKKPKSHGEGGVYRQNGTNNSNCTKWMIVIPLGKINGKYKQKKKRFDGTYTEAMAMKRQMLNERDAGSIAAMNGSVGEWLDAFALKRANSGNYAQRTLQIDQYRKETLKRHLDDIMLPDLNADHINSAYAKYRSGDTASGRKMTGTTLLGVHKFLKMALKEPMKKRVVDPDLFDEVVTPVSDTPEKKALQNNDVIQLMEKFDVEDYHYMGLMLCIAVGLRRSESMAVRWEDIDLDANVLHLCRSLNPDGTEKGTKNGKTRDLPLSSKVKNALIIRRNAQKRIARIAAGAFKLGDSYDEKIYKKRLSEMIYVCSDRSTPLKSASFKDWWDYHKESMGVSCTIHELRHTFLTLLARAKVHPRVMQDLGGHMTMDITMGIYTHVDMAEKQQAAEAVDTMLLKAKCANANGNERAVIALAAAISILKETAHMSQPSAETISYTEELLNEGQDYLGMLLEKARAAIADQADIVDVQPVNAAGNVLEASLSLFEQGAESKCDYSCQNLLMAS